MEVKIKPFDALPCALKVFTINGINADKDDFGVGRDVDEFNADPYCCGYWKFTARSATQAVLNKYKISADEYNEVAQMLESTLDVGRCGWCD